MSKLSHEEFCKKVPNKKEYKIIGIYTNARAKILIENRYGNCLVTPSSLLNGSVPTISTAINKTEYFINQAKEIHGEKYDYSKFLYEKSQSNSIIICKNHGDFKQLPHNHLLGVGCPQCGFKGGYRKTDFIKNSKNKECIFYILKLFNENEKFYKIGITSRSTKLRYNTKKLMPYNYEVIKEIKSADAGYIWDLENQSKKILKNYKYTPFIYFQGCTTECFSNVNLILNMIAD